jgi:hypothetical protein
VTLAEGTAPLGYPVYCAGHTAVVIPFYRRQRDGRMIPSYEFDGRTWRKISTPPADLGGQPSVWTGTELVIWGGAEYFGDPSARAYNLATNTWRTVKLPPITRYSYRLWTGSEILVYPGDGPNGVTRMSVP